MTPRLPTPGGDANDWGTILNTFLEVAHNSDGTLNTNAVATALPLPISVANLGTGTPSVSNFLRGDGSWAVPTGGAVSSVFGRAGAVTAQSGDYTAAEITNAADKSSSSTQTFTGDVSTPVVIASGISGDTLSSRYVGSTVSGAPTAGAFLIGDFVIDQTGKLWICTTAGSPGTWTKASLTLDATASDIQALGSSAAAGSTGKAADAGHVHPTTGIATLSGSTFVGYVAPAWVSLAYSTSIAVNAALGNDFAVTLTSSGGTLANPTNPVAGQIIRLHITQGTGGNFTVSYGSAYNFGAAGQPTLSTTATDVDILAFQYDPNLTQWCFIGAGLGF